MKKTFQNTMLFLCMLLIIIPNTVSSAAAAEPLTDTEIEQRIYELNDLLGEKYFTANGKGCGKKTSDHGCSNCNVNNVIKSPWFKDIFGTVKTSQMFLNGGMSCMGFVEFAEWYIFREDNNDTVLRTKSNQATKYSNGFNYNTISQNAHIGDYIRVGGHSFIYINADSAGVTMLDCNWNGSYNCMVDIHKINYSKYAGEPIWISKMYSKAAGNSQTTNKPTSNSPSTLSINSPTHPMGTLKQGSRYSLKGTITSNYNITLVKAEILSSEGNVVFSYTQKPNTKSFSLLNSKLDANMKFNELSPGKYYLTYTAEDASGRPEGKKAWSSEFTIAGEEKTPSTLKIVADSYPSGAIKEGSRYSLKGTISSNYSIVSVKGEIVDSNGSVMFSYTQRPNTKSFSILNSKLDANMKFNELSPGEYCLKYTAEDESGEQKTWSSGSFTVQGTKAERTYTVTFDANGGSVSPRTKIITADELIGALPTPVREGYDFVGWGTSRSSNMIVTPDNFWVEEDITLYAHWWQQPTEQTPDDGKADEQPSGGNADPEPERGYWKEWSEWSPARVTSSSTRRVETREALVSESRTEYRYVRYADATGTHICWCAKYLESRPYVSGKASLQYSDWNTTRYNSNGKGWSCGYCNGSHIGSDKTGSDGRSWWAEYVLPSGSYYWEESRTIPATYETQYRYSDWISG